MIRAVVFDLDGVLLGSEPLWDQARREVVADSKGHWHDDATAIMQGMSSLEWSRYIAEELGVDLSPPEIVDVVVSKLLASYDKGLPLLPGADDAVRRVAARWPLALASSSNRVVIDRVLSITGWGRYFQATVSSEEVPKGKPSPDVYLEAARRLEKPPELCAAVEDSANGIRSAVAAGLQVVAVPNEAYTPPEGVLMRAEAVIWDLSQLTAQLLDSLGGGEMISEDLLDQDHPFDEEGDEEGEDGEEGDEGEEQLDEEEDESFPASDPHSEWAGPEQTLT